MDCEIAWAGGLFEGEGCIMFDKDGRAVARINMTDLEPLERFHSALGCGRLNGPYRPRSERRKPYWVWIARGPEGLVALDLLEPWLSARRLAKIAEVRQKVAEYRSGVRSRGRASGWERQRLAAAVAR